MMPPMAGIRQSQKQHKVIKHWEKYTNGRHDNVAKLPIHISSLIGKFIILSNDTISKLD